MMEACKGEKIPSHHCVWLISLGGAITPKFTWTLLFLVYPSNRSSMVSTNSLCGRETDT